MGNSGSMHGLSSYEEGYHHPGGVPGYHHHHQRYHDAMRGESAGGAGPSASWMDAYQRGGDHGRRAAGAPHDYDYHHHLHELKVDDGHFAGSQPQQQQQQQIKVLPDIPGKVAKLRSTNNGNILHAGGTISKNNQALQRSKSISSPTYQQHQQQQHASYSECDEDTERNAMAPRMLMTRSRTQLNVRVRGRDDGDGKWASGMEHRAGRPSASRAQYPREPSPKSSADAAALNNRKRFGSEPDLRLSLAPRHGAPTPEQQQQQQQQQQGGGTRKPNTAQSKIMKGKNKKKAPVPPPVEKERQREPSKGPDRQRIIAYSPLRNPNPETNTSTLPSSCETGYSVTATRKLRLFKTRAETKKTPIIAKLPEASDAKFSSGHAAAQLPGGTTLMKHGAPATTPFRSPSTSSTSSQLVLAHHHQLRPAQHMRSAHTLQHQQRSEHPVDGTADPEPHCATALERISTRPNPTSFFRREKTFDAGLLGLERKRAVEAQPVGKPTLSPPLSRRKSIVKSLLEQEGNGRAAEQRKREPPASAAVPITDFQKELQLATRRQEGPPVQPAAHPTPCQIHVLNPSPSEPLSWSAPKAKPLTTNALLIAVAASGKDAEREPKLLVEPPAVDARDMSPPATPPPPPPPPKTSFYFGMSKQRDARAEQGDRSLPASANERLAEYLAERKAHTQRLAESKVDDGPDEKGRAATGAADQEADDRSTPDEIGHTQMELIDQFAASLLNGSRFRSSDSVASSEADVRMGRDSWEDGHQEIALKLRPTLPRKQFDIPRFSPAAAWRHLTTEDEFCRDVGDVLGGGGTGTHDDFGGVGGAGVGGEKKAFLRGGFEQELEVPEDRIQRVYREPVPALQDNKSGDSGISGDAGLPDLGEQPLLKERAGGSTPENNSQRTLPPRKASADGGVLHGGVAGGGGGWSSNALLLMPWTPQQDLEDDDDTTTGSGSEPPSGQLIEDGTGDPGVHADGSGSYSSKGHLFSLSLPRENHLSIYNVEVTDEKVEKHMFNSLQKFRKSVTCAFKGEESGPIDTNDNWFLGRLDTDSVGVVGSRVGNGGPEKRQKLLGSQPTSYTSLDRSTGRDRDAGSGGGGGGAGGGTGVTVAASTQSKHCSISYLVSGKHMMYLPREPTKTVGHERASVGGCKLDQNNNSRTYRNQNGDGSGSQPGPRQQQHQLSTAHKETPRKATPTYGSGDKENLQDPVPAGGAPGELDHFPVKLSNRRNHRFTFQSTIRQIEKRRVAEKLSREAEIKEAMRLSELEAMRRVEEEFQKKRAREKASIRHQLRLFSMENQPDEGQLEDGEQDLTGDTTRSDPDGDSLPHQNSGGGVSGSVGGRGLYRRKPTEFTSMERQRQSKRMNGTHLEDGTGVRSTPTVGSFHHFLQQDANIDDEEDRMMLLHQHRNHHHPDDRYLPDDDAVDGGDGDGDGDGDSSSLGYVDTRTPYISRIIQAKSSKSYGIRK